MIICEHCKQECFITLVVTIHDGAHSYDEDWCLPCIRRDHKISYASGPLT